MNTIVVNVRLAASIVNLLKMRTLLNQLTMVEVKQRRLTLITSSLLVKNTYLKVNSHILALKRSPASASARTSSLTSVQRYLTYQVKYLSSKQRKVKVKLTQCIAV